MASKESSPFERDENRTAQPPFLLELRCEEITPGGKFTPSALVALNRAWLETEWVRSIRADDMVTLLLVLACVTPDGRFEATPHRLAPILGQSVETTRQRLERLRAIHWGHMPLLDGATTPSGLERFWPNPSLLGVQQRTLGPPPVAKQLVQPVQAAALISTGNEPTITDYISPQDVSPELLPLQSSSTSAGSPPSHRQQVIAHSRATYARPRALVEAEIAEFLKPISSARGTARDTIKAQQSSAFLERASGNTGGLGGIAGIAGGEPGNRVQTESSGAAGRHVKGVTNASTNASTSANTKPNTKAGAASRDEKNEDVAAHKRAQLQESTPAIEPAITPEVRAWHALKRRLVGVGLSEEQASGLLDAYPLDRIERQLEWLPYRYARNPAYYLLAAIKADYAAPPQIALQNLPPVEVPHQRDSNASRQENFEQPDSGRCN